ncbi:kelch-like protein 5 [Paramacrobiotus metropolitanus]|uniref:kelch-like protein 5 n=1 Tax=Paramacrobiotus metropolitanus TaxID=2943436 RepID=UPI002445A0E9|nr:kelch-like protein 5 [Paramacrobiotus metropolitanus]
MADADLRDSDDCLDHLRKVRLANEPCDVDIVVGEERFMAHRAILSAVSPYFRTMFSPKYVEHYQRQIQLAQADATAVGLLLDFAYTGKLEICEDNVETLLITADRLEFCIVRKECCEFLAEQLDAGNCLGIARFAHSLGCTDLEKKAKQFANKHFLDVVREDEFYHLSECELCEIISSQYLTVNREDDVLQAALRWIHSNWKMQNFSVDRILAEIKMSFLDYKAILSIFKEFQDDADFLSLVAKPIEDVILFVRNTIGCGPLQRERNSIRQFAYVVGGSAGSAECDTVERYDPLRDEWISMKSLEGRRGWSPRGAAVDNKMHIFCTDDKDGRPATQEIYTSFRNFWKASPMILTGLSENPVADDSAVVALQGSIFVIGGSGPMAMPINSVRMFNPESGTWSYKASLKRARISPAAVVTRSGQLYVAGGYIDTSEDGEICNVENSVEHYSSATDEWTYMTPMLKARSNFGLVELNGCLYAIGGRGLYQTLVSCEKYNPHTDTWTLVANLNVPRNGHMVFVLHNKIYVCGGLDGVEYLTSVESYCPLTNAWTLRADMTQERWDAVVGILEAPLYPSETEQRDN